MPSYGSIPPHFDDKLTPPGYGAWSRTFAGPADFWIVIRAAYMGQENGDFELLGILKGAGATFKVSMAFLRSYEPIYGDTPAYWQVRNEVESLAGVDVTKHQKYRDNAQHGTPTCPPPLRALVSDACGLI
jgi:hypothetical protein